MSSSSRPLAKHYPPSANGYPQFIVPFGDASGKRAALRLFFGVKEARQLPRAAFDFDAATTRWTTLQTCALPHAFKDHELRPSAIDLDPQVLDLPRSGSSFALPIDLLLTALGTSELFSTREEEEEEETSIPPPFHAEVGSLWALSSEDTDELARAAQFERFIDYCTVDVSSTRHLLFAPDDARELLMSRLEELEEELEVAHYDFDEALGKLRPIFFAQEGISRHIVLFYDTEPSCLNVLLEVFSSCWLEGLERASRARPSSSPRHSSHHSHALKPGTLLGERYEIISRIGAGGFAVVYEAQDTKVPREVAIKVIDLERNLDERSRQSFIKRFEREARLAVSVHHPCVVEIFDLGVTDEEVPYIVMERLHGWDLDSQIQRAGPMKATRIIPLFLQALEGLGVAHELDIVHKDLKPSNIFMKNPGKRHEQLCILDFGVARRINTTTARLTHTDSAFGTPHYMAPEYSTSQIATPALDVYQMGLILVELLMGEPVVSHPEPVAAMFQHVRGDLMIPQALLDAPLGPIIRKALHSNHLHRYQDAFEFADALRQLESLADIPHLKREAKKASIQPASLSDPLSDVRETPVIGANLISTDRYSSSKQLALAGEHAPSLAHEVAPVMLGVGAASTPGAVAPEISPFASTLPFDDLSEQLTAFDGDATSRGERAEEDEHREDVTALQELFPPPRRPRAELEVLTKDLSPKADEAPDDHVSMLQDFSSKRPYVVLISVLLLALIALSVALLRNTRQLHTLTPLEENSTEVVTEYDRQLAALRERAAGLEPMLERGEIEEVIDEIDAMDASKVRLPKQDEIEQVKAILSRAKQERVNRGFLERAKKLAEEREHELALDTLDRMHPQSIFWNHPDTAELIGTVEVALILEIERQRSMYPERALALARKLAMHDVQNAELQRLIGEIQEGVRAQPPSMLPVDPERHEMLEALDQRGGDREEVLSQDEDPALRPSQNAFKSDR